MSTTGNTQGFSTNLGLPTLPDIDQFKYPEIFSQFLLIQNAIGVLQSALDQYTGVQGAGLNNYATVPANAYFGLQNISRYYVLASEHISTHAMVNFYNSGGVLTARNASAADDTKPCFAYCNSVGGLDSGAIGEFVLFVYLPIAILSPAGTYYLSTTPGLITGSPITSPGTITQSVGYALSSTGLFFNPNMQWVTN